MPPPYSFSFALSEDELAEIHVEIVRFTTMGRKRIAAARTAARGLMIGAVIMSGIAVFGVVRSWSGWLNILDSNIVGFAVSVALWALGWSLWRGNSPKRIRKKSLASIRSVGMFSLRQPHIVTLGPNAFRFEGDGIVSETAWKHFDEAAAGENFILLVKHDASAHVVPRRVIGDSGTADQIADQCRTWIKEGGGGTAYAVASLLSDRDVPCPKCGYNLRNQPRPICPECGHPLDQHELYAKLVQQSGKINA